MNLRGFTFGVFAVLFAMLTFSRAAVAAVKCETLATVLLADTTITLAQSVASGAFSVPVTTRQWTPQEMASFKRLPAFCRVAATLRPAFDSDIKIEVWMPLENWI